MTKPRYLVLSDGTIYAGTAFGGTTISTGELVFNTGMTGYQESITDQSYNGEILMFTYPLIGNYGINFDDDESVKPTTAGVVVHELARRASNWRSQMSLAEFLKRHQIPGITDLDTRSITKKIRSQGAMVAALVDTKEQIKQFLERSEQTNQIDLVVQSSTNNAYPNPNIGLRIVVVDYGLKHSILRELSKRKCNVVVLPATATAQQVLSYQPDGVLLSNGPGDPKNVPAALEMIRTVEQRVPLFGICLGHQLFALANGADTFKMKFGHRGFNHPIREIATNRIDFTAQNHGYAVAAESIVQTNLLVTHQEINDQTIEGLRHKQYPAFSVQFHPDAAPGPHDASHLFDDFLENIVSYQRQRSISNHA
ncbi:glutamine-hydrolyzing carbamoyl-phosphate synthase small subunit [Paucilactobacillus kaifaensis]|uniref:glutamine-hydrolyzing carbamoyl-phosphate synthase small subunit n=1 Tax=Paucilactobacillus kaifaensis TaxID=2559921 RepID=UPI0010F6F2DF|nr:glutamine-hydrolyzing carbamoyl-phosphate synthase small subunit [Paucilactobacillus kaifaensis]